MNPTPSIHLPSPDAYFDALETHFHQLSAAVSAGDIDALPTLAAQVQGLAVALASDWPAVRGHGDNDTRHRQRVRAMADGLNLVRANLLRRSSVVEQALHVLMPAATDPTYAGGGSYGAGPKSSGRLPRLSA
ncbi:MAG: hypothetical protein QE265_12730 [Rhodoferax sp.]|nr:hypothetical protein [Rhodoferax sp.]